MQPVIAYYRVSTAQQGRSGLGLDAQRKAVEDHAATTGRTIVAEYTEIESGKKDDRPALEQALMACKKQKATLMIAKLDRLSRRLSMITRLQDSKVDFIACDNPHASKFTVQILGAVAELERDMISKRTKEGLAAAKARGVKLGCPAGTDAMRAAAAARDAAVAPILAEFEGCSSRVIAQALTNRGIASPRGGAWSQKTVLRVIERLGAASLCETLDAI